MKKKKIFKGLEVEILLVTEDLIRTSYGNDGNVDGDWEDENVQPI